MWPSGSRGCRERQDLAYQTNIFWTSNILRKIIYLCQVEGTVNEDAMLGVAKKLRQEREHEKELHAQKGDQRTAIQHIEQRVQRMEAKLKDSRQQVCNWRSTDKAILPAIP